MKLPSTQYVDSDKAIYPYPVLFKLVLSLSVKSPSSLP